MKRKACYKTLKKKKFTFLGIFPLQVRAQAVKISDLKLHLYTNLLESGRLSN
jgi:hypothetical protein